MALYSEHVERDERIENGRTVFTDVIAMKPIGYRDAGVLRRIIHDWENGDANFPHAITKAGILVYTAADGQRRICPTRDPLRYVEIGAPYLKPAGTWSKVNLGAATRKGNAVTWQTPQALVNVEFGGHFVDLSCEFLGGWRPPGNMIAFPVGMNGLTRSGLTFLQDGLPVLSLRPMTVTDMANPMDVRAVDTRLAFADNRWWAVATIPSLAGMGRPRLDPQLVLQPDAADGVDSWLDQANPATVHGTNTELPAVLYSVGRILRSLVLFDLSSIPPGAIVTASTLTLTAMVTGTYLATNVFRILLANNDWSEPSTNWSFRTGITPWAGSVGCGTADTDYDSTALGEFAVTALTVGDVWNVSLSTSGTTAMIAANAGILLRAANETTINTSYAASSDHATAAYRPKLVIDYTLAASGGGARRMLMGVGR